MGGWGLKLALVVQKSATLRSYILLFLSMLRSNLANLLTLRLFSQTVLYLKMKKARRDPMTRWILGRATNWFWSLKNRTILFNNLFIYLPFRVYCLEWSKKMQWCAGWNNLTLIFTY